MQIITQSAMIRFINANPSVIDPLGGKTLAELGLQPQNVISMSHKAEAIVAFHAIKFNRVSGIAVVDGNEVYLGTMSVSDLKVSCYLEPNNCAL